MEEGKKVEEEEKKTFRGGRSVVKIINGGKVVLTKEMKEVEERKAGTKINVVEEEENLQKEHEKMKLSILILTQLVGCHELLGLGVARW